MRELDLSGYMVAVTPVMMETIQRSSNYFYEFGINAAILEREDLLRRPSPDFSYQCIELFVRYL